MNMSLYEDLEAILETYADEVEPQLWMWEADRWDELVFCIIEAELDGDSFTARRVSAALSASGVGSAQVLGQSGDIQTEVLTAVSTILRVGGVDQEVAIRLASHLQKVGQASLLHYDGRLQLFLRKHGELMREQLTESLQLTGEKMATAVTHWLQNATNMPLTADDPATRRFRARLGISVHDLERTADELGVNIAVVDDAIRALETDRIGRADRSNAAQ